MTANYGMPPPKTYCTAVANGYGLHEPAGSTALWLCRHCGCLYGGRPQ